MLLFVFLLLSELGLLGFFSAGTVLSSAAGVPHDVDLVVVLGGGPDRYPRGRDLVFAGYSKRFLLISPSASERKDAQNRLPGTELVVDDTPRNTWNEAQVVRTLMRANGWRTALVVSDPPHLMRAAYAWSSAFRGTDLTYTLISSDTPWWPGWRWWRNPQAADFVGSEVLKLGYYLLRYPFGFSI
jgi:uncharacterized SAM-binding protein YcdF (DUF218 family)